MVQSERDLCGSSQLPYPNEQTAKEREKIGDDDSAKETHKMTQVGEHRDRWTERKKEIGKIAPAQCAVGNSEKQVAPLTWLGMSDSEERRGTKFSVYQTPRCVVDP